MRQTSQPSFFVLRAEHVLKNRICRSRNQHVLALNERENCGDARWRYIDYRGIYVRSRRSFGCNSMKIEGRPMKAKTVKNNGWR